MPNSDESLEDSDEQFSKAVAVNDLDEVCKLLPKISEKAFAEAISTVGRHPCLLHVAVKNGNDEAIKFICAKALKYVKLNSFFTSSEKPVDYVVYLKFLFAKNQDDNTAMDLVYNPESNDRYHLHCTNHLAIAKALVTQTQKSLQYFLKNTTGSEQHFINGFVENASSGKHWLVRWREAFKSDTEGRALINELLRHVLPNIKMFNKNQTDFIIMLYLKLFDVLDDDVKDLLYLRQLKLRKALAKRKPSEIISRDKLDTKYKPLYRSTRTFEAGKPVQLQYGHKNPDKIGGILIPAEEIHQKLAVAHVGERKIFSGKNVITAAITFIVSTVDSTKTRKYVTIYISDDDIKDDDRNYQEFTYAYQLWLAYRIFHSFDKDAINGFLTTFQEDAAKQVRNTPASYAQLKYHHSEMALAYHLTRKENITKLVQKLRADEDITGNEKVMAVVFDIHSTNSPCSHQCRRVLYSLLRDNHDRDGFLYQLQNELYAGGTGFALPKRVQKKIYRAVSVKEDRLRTMLRYSYHVPHMEQDDNLSSEVDCLEINHPTHQEQVLTFEFKVDADDAAASAAHVAAPSPVATACTFFYSGKIDLAGLKLKAEQKANAASGRKRSDSSETDVSTSDATDSSSSSSASSSLRPNDSEDEAPEEPATKKSKTEVATRNRF